MEASKTKEPPKEELKVKLDRLRDNTEAYFKTYGQLLKARGAKTASGVTSQLAVGIVMLVLGVFSFVFLSLALAWWLGTIFESHALGFLAVGVFFILLIVIALSLRKKVIAPAIKNIIISKIYE